MKIINFIQEQVSGISLLKNYKNIYVMAIKNELKIYRSPIATL